MAIGRFTPLELGIMKRLWDAGPASVREVQESFPAGARPAYTTVQTTIYRLEAKGAVTRVRKVGNAHVFAAAVSRTTTFRRLVDELVGLFGGRAQPVMAHLVETGRLTLEDLREAQAALRAHDMAAKRDAAAGEGTGQARRSARGVRRSRR